MREFELQKDRDHHCKKGQIQYPSHDSILLPSPSDLPFKTAHSIHLPPPPSVHLPNNTTSPTTTPRPLTMLPFSFSACAKSVLGECNCRQPLGKRGCSLVATFGSPLMGFSISFIHPTSFQGTVWLTVVNQRITEDNGNKPIVLLHKKACSSK